MDVAHGIALDELSEDERDAAISLAAAGVLEIRQEPLLHPSRSSWARSAASGCG